MVNLDMNQAELRQAQVALQQQMLKAEQFTRMCVLLAKSIETGTDDLLVRVEGKIAVRAEAFQSVPKRWTISLRAAKIKASDDPLAMEEDVIVLDVQDAKPRSTLVVPTNGVAL